MAKSGGENIDTIRLNRFKNRFFLFMHKPRYMKKQANKIKDETNNKEISENNILCGLHLWSDSSLIPFKQTEASKEIYSWMSNWNQSQPTCLLFGPISCGKSRLIEYISKSFSLHIMEIDCASSKNIQKCLIDADEATQSHSVGSLISDPGCKDSSSPTSMVVFEHIDAIVTGHSKPPPSFIKLISTSRVPIILTSQVLLLDPAPWLVRICVIPPSDVSSIIMNSVWLKDQILTFDKRSHVDALLQFTDKDIRQTSIQSMWKISSDNFLSKQEQFFLSVPVMVSEILSQSKKMRVYSGLCDLLSIFGDENDCIEEYIRPISRRIFSKKREYQFESYYNFASDRIPHSDGGLFEKHELVDMTYIAAQNAYEKTRTRKAVSFRGLHSISSDDISEITKWKLWPCLRGN